MPSKYMIHTAPVAGRFEAITKSGVIAWEEGCLKCALCVKKQCVYHVYEQRGLDPRQMIDSIDNQCMNCLRCVQNCPKELIHKSVNPVYQGLGDDHWTPEVITRLWYQAETGKIPVSGAGYPGPFSGPGFDSMWTDMSEIVRPTRDGIHGREYISTAVDLGRTHRHLVFTKNGELESDFPHLMDIPLPMILRAPAFGSLSRATLAGWAGAAKRLNTLLALPESMLSEEMEVFGPHLIPLFPGGPVNLSKLGEDTPMVEIPWQEDWQEIVKEIGDSRPSILLSIRLPLVKGVEDQALALLEAGIPIIHLEATDRGRALDDDSLFIKDGVRALHLALVNAGVRDEVTLLVSGGISMAEYVAKALICGADAVFVDLPLLIALECRVCRRCTRGLACPVEIEKASAAWIESRVVNLFGAWHSQILEVMGAMGIRDARRLRGEAGRAMFFEDLDKSTFASLGRRKEGYELE